MKKQNLPAMRINRLLSDSGVCSRREADRMIEEGRVTIDGRTAVLGDQVAAEAVVAVDGRPVRAARPRSTGAQQARRHRVHHRPPGADERDRLPELPGTRVSHRAAGQGFQRPDPLDHDGGIVNRILRAAGGHEKEYRVSLTQPVTEDFLRRMASGVEILDRTTLPCRVWKTGDRSFGIILVQGINRQIRRMCDALGYRVHTLERVPRDEHHAGRPHPRSLPQTHGRGSRAPLGSDGKHAGNAGGSAGGKRRERRPRTPAKGIESLWTPSQGENEWGGSLCRARFSSKRPTQKTVPYLVPFVGVPRGFNPLGGWSGGRSSPASLRYSSSSSGSSSSSSASGSRSTAMPPVEKASRSCFEIAA